MHQLKYIILGITLFLFHVPLMAGEKNFYTDGINHFKLSAPFSKILQAKKSESNFLNMKNHEFQGTLSYVNNGTEVLIPVVLSIKGFSSMANCDFPKLELRIENHKETIFSGNKKIDLNTHCDDFVDPTPENQMAFARSMFYAHREVAAYRILETFGIESYRTKAVVMTYIDSDTNIKPEKAFRPEYQAFFIEDKSAFLKRKGYTEIFGENDPFRAFFVANKKTLDTQYIFKSVSENSDKFDLMYLAKIELFQNLIINGDWHVRANSSDLRRNGSAEQLWNAKLFVDPQGNWILTPQDFNLSTLCYFDVMGKIPVEHIQVPVKYISQLSPSKKLELKNFLSSKRVDILMQVEMLSEDPSYEAIKNFLDARITMLISKLE